MATRKALFESHKTSLIHTNLVSIEKRSRDPKVPDLVLYHKRDAARTQLETAITLWFHYADPISTHTLAAASNKCYHGMGSKVGKPTIIQAWKKSLSRPDYDRAVKAENFAKHANTDADATLHLITEQAALMMLDSVICHEKIFGSRTPLMTCFFARLAFENPRLAAHVNLARRKQGLEDLVIEQTDQADRVQFFNRELPTIIAASCGIRADSVGRFEEGHTNSPQSN